VSSGELLSRLETVVETKSLYASDSQMQRGHLVHVSVHTGVEPYSQP
jgi:hypothetical protein